MKRSKSDILATFLPLAMTSLLAVGCIAADGEDSSLMEQMEEDVEESSEALIDVYRLEAEHGPWANGYPKYIYNGNGASGDAYAGLLVNGGPYYFFNAPSYGWYRIGSRVAGMPCKGDAQLQFLIDAVVYGSRTVPAGWNYQYGDWAYLAPGTHSYAVGFANDYADSSCDRNLLHDYSVIQQY